MNNKKGVLNLVVFLLTLVVGLFVLKPIFAQYSDLKLGLDEKEKMQSELTNKLNGLKNSETNLEGSSEIAKSKSLTAIPKRFEQDKLIAELTEIAKKNGASLNSISFGVVANSSEKVKRATLNVNVTADYQDLVSFLKGIENAQRKFLVKSIVVQVAKLESGERVNFNVNMETFYQDRI